MRPVAGGGVGGGGAGGMPEGVAAAASAGAGALRVSSRELEAAVAKLQTVVDSLFGREYEIRIENNANSYLAINTPDSAAHEALLAWVKGNKSLEVGKHCGAKKTFLGVGVRPGYLFFAELRLVPVIAEIPESDLALILARAYVKEGKERLSYYLMNNGRRSATELNLPGVEGSGALYKRGVVALAQLVSALNPLIDFESPDIVGIVPIVRDYSGLLTSLVGARTRLRQAAEAYTDEEASAGDKAEAKERVDAYLQSLTETVATIEEAASGCDAAPTAEAAAGMTLGK